MITHKIRIYPNAKMKNFLDSQFEFSRRDYNRQLKMIVDGIREKRIHEGNFVQALERIKLHAIKSVQSMGGSLPYFPDITARNAKRLVPVAKTILRTRVFPPFRKPQRGSHFLHLTSAGNPNFAFSLPQSKKLQIGSFGSIRMSEKLRFSSPLSCTIEEKNDRYFACFLFKDSITPYPKTGKITSIVPGTRTTIIGMGSDNKTRAWSLNEKSVSKLLKRCSYLSRLLRQKEPQNQTKSSKRFDRNLHKLRSARQKLNNQISSFLEQTSHSLLWKFDRITAESPATTTGFHEKRCLRVQSKNAYSQLLKRVVSKAIQVEKEANVTSPVISYRKTCKDCGSQLPLLLWSTHYDSVCPFCNAKIRPNINAATNILRGMLYAKSSMSGP